MSLLVLGAASMVAAAVLADKVDKSAPQPEETPTTKKPIVERELWTGRYGTNEELMWVLKDPSQIASVQSDVDLSGVPCRWVKMHNGAKYQVYNKDLIDFLSTLGK